MTRTLHDYCLVLGEEVVEIHGDANVAVDGATADSRQVRPGWLFVAIPGERADGTDFLPAAIAAGAVAAVVAKPLPAPATVPVVRVRDAYAACALVAELAADQPAATIRCLGITGTNGKTTCAYLLRDVLRRSGRRAGMLGTVQYDFGDGSLATAERTTPTPFVLQRLLQRARQAGCQDLVAEVSSHALHQKRFGSTRFAGAIFTNLTGDHLDYHRTMDAYFEAKSRLFYESLGDDGVAVVNLDDPWGVKLADGLRRRRPALRVATYGFVAAADYRIRECLCERQGSSCKLATPSGVVDISSPLPGRFNAANVAAVAALALALEVPADELCQAVADFTGAPGRMQAVDADDGRLVVVDYAHTDDALENVLQTLKDLHPRRLTVVFGCGGERDRGKRRRMGEVAARLADRIVVTSDNPRGECPELIINDICCGLGGAHATRVLDRRQAIRQALAAAQPGDIVLVAGKGHECYQEIAGVKHPFDDLAEVKRALADGQSQPEKQNASVGDNPPEVDESQTRV